MTPARVQHENRPECYNFLMPTPTIETFPCTTLYGSFRTNVREYYRRFGMRTVAVIRFIPGLREISVRGTWRPEIMAAFNRQVSWGELSLAFGRTEHRLGS